MIRGSVHTHIQKKKEIPEGPESLTPREKEVSMEAEIEEGKD